MSKRNYNPNIEFPAKTFIVHERPIVNRYSVIFGKSMNGICWSFKRSDNRQVPYTVHRNTKKELYIVKNVKHNYIPSLIFTNRGKASSSHSRRKEPLNWAAKIGHFQRKGHCDLESGGAGIFCFGSKWSMRGERENYEELI